jgi:hypothetical protein
METERVITCSQLQTEPRIPVGSAEEYTGGVVSGREWMGYLRVPVTVYFQVPRCRSLLGTARRGGWTDGLEMDGRTARPMSPSSHASLSDSL